jgi:choline dehydrogenase-like flavoprotein
VNNDPPANLHVLYNTTVTRVVLEPISSNGHAGAPPDGRAVPAAARPSWVATGVEASTLVTPTTNPDLSSDAALAPQRIIKVLKARNEIVLSAGSYNSPTILMQSGIGPKAHIEEVGVQGGCKVDLPYVGSNLDDHLLVFNFYQLNSNLT